MAYVEQVLKIDQPLLTDNQFVSFFNLFNTRRRGESMIKNDFISTPPPDFVL